MANSFLTPQVVAAFAGLGGVLLGSLISWGVQGHLLGRRIQADESLAERKFKFDKELAERKFEFDKELAARKVDADIAIAEKKFALDRAFAAWTLRTEIAEEVLAELAPRRYKNPREPQKDRAIRLRRIRHRQFDRIMIEKPSARRFVE